jgi:signal transduction histidine kinase
MAASGSAYVKLTLADTGTGMDPQTAERAFEPFFTTKDNAKASGLGLSMVYGFARQSMGMVRIASEQGAGSTVTLILPVAKPA